MEHSPRLRPFDARDKFGYFFGDVANDCTFILSTSILLKFYTDVMGVSAAVVGTVMMLARFVDAFTDVTMGRIVDACRPTAAGKFKPWLRRMCVPVAAASFLIYAPGLAGDVAARWSGTAKLLYLILTYLLWGSFCYTGVNIPYGSMASAISSESGDRASLSTYRTMGGMLAGMVIGIVLPIACYDTIPLAGGGTTDVLNGTKVAIFAAIMSVSAIVCYLISYHMITERIPYQAPEKREQKTSVGKMLANAVKNRALLSIIVASVLMLMAQLTMQNMGSYIYPDYYGNASMQSLSSIFRMIGMSVAAAIAKPLSNRFGKAEVSGVSSLFGAAVFALIWLIKPANVWGYILLQTLCWLGLGVFSMICWALITDVIDYAELQNGVREDGSVYALYSFSRKLGQALASGVSGWLLTAIGYNEMAASQAIPQTAAVKNGIFNISTLVPAAGFLLLGLALLFWYPLHKKQVDANTAALKARRGE